jgi:NAD(P)-dependent dehydrogenase (short-subunit alcohol dehydrogenase family)
MGNEHDYRDPAADQVAEMQRKIQREIDALDQQRSSDGGGQQPSAPPPTGTHPEPAPPFPDQRLQKPGEEADLELAPRYMAPDYRGSGKLQDMAAIVTGGDSGIGRAVAVLYAREGADVAIVYLNEHEDAEETRRCVEREGRRCVLISGDVRDPKFCQQAVERTLQAFGKLDILVNNAAFQQHASALEDISEEHFDMTLRTNIYGYFHMAKAALPHMKAGASIVNSGSETGFFGNKSLLDYSTTKGAIHAFTKSLASNLAERGIRVNAVAPGPVWTPLNPADRPSKKLEKFGSGTSMKRPAQPEELSPAYVFLASPVCASFITGAVLPVMGGPTG